MESKIIKWENENKDEVEGEDERIRMRMGEEMFYKQDIVVKTI